jgi:hypothetical protein
MAVFFILYNIMAQYIVCVIYCFNIFTAVCVCALWLLLLMPAVLHYLFGCFNGCFPALCCWLAVTVAAAFIEYNRVIGRI